MGFFGSLFGKAATPPVTATVAGDAPRQSAASRSFPAVKAPPGLADRYAGVFRDEMTSIGLLSRAEVESALAVVVDGEGGCANQGRYGKPLFEQYFSGKEWRWPWYDHWAAKFASLGDYPSNWPYLEREPVVPTVQTRVERLTVADLKRLMMEANIPFSETAKGAELRAIVFATAANTDALTACTTWRSTMEAAANARGYPMFLLLFRTMLFRAQSATQNEHAAGLGIRKWRRRGALPSDLRFAELALAENPDAIGPLYPGELSIMVPILPALDES